MTSVRRQIYLSKVVVDRWVVIGQFMLRAKAGRRGEMGVAMTPPPKLAMILTLVSSFKSVSAMQIRCKCYEACDQK